jgi:hypothetical protein
MAILLAETGQEVHGYVVLEFMRTAHTRVGMILDLQGDSEQVLNALLSTAMSLAEQHGVHLVYCDSIAPLAYRRAFRRNGFLSFPPLKSPTLIAYSNSPNVPPEVLRNPHHWLIHSGDIL